jgi:hypothetical protein
MTLNLKTETELQQQAQAGDGQAIAYWLNLGLLAQQQCARVSTPHPQYLDIQIRCRQYPDCDRLLQFVHHRLSRLHMPHLRGASVQISIDRPDPQVIAERFLVFEAPTPAAVPSASPRPAARKHAAAVPAPSKSPWLVFTTRLCQIQRQIQHQGQSLWAKRPVPKFSHPAPRLAAPSTSRRSFIQDQRWGVLCGGAIATFLLGASYEAVTYYGTSPLRRSSRMLPSVALPFPQRSNRPPIEPVDTLWLGDQAVPVYPVPMHASRSDPATVTLLFTPNLANRQFPSTSPLSVPPADIWLSTVDTAGKGSIPELSAKGAVAQMPLSGQGTPATVIHLSGHLQAEAGAGAALRTRNALEWQGFYTTIPPARATEASLPLVLAIQDQQIAYLSVAIADLDEAHLQAVKTHLAADLQALRRQVDWIVVNYDSEADLAAYPADWQIEMARFAIDQGANVVVGYHPTMVQGAEYYNTGAIAYALGWLDLLPASEGSSSAAVPLGFQVQLRHNRPLQAEFVPLSALETGLHSSSSPDSSTQPSTLPRPLQGYLQQASGLFDHPIPAVSPSRSPSDGSHESQPAPADHSDLGDRQNNSESFDFDSFTDSVSN